MNNYWKEIKAIFILLIAVVVFSAIGILFNFILTNKILRDISIGYFILFIILFTSTFFIKNKIYQKVVNFILFPVAVLYALLIVLIPIGTLIMHALFYFGITAVIPIIIFKLLIFFKILPPLNPEFIIYLEITLVVFLSVLFNYQVRKLIYKFSPARIHTSEKLKPFGLDKLTDYLLSESNIRFIIYFLYVVLLFIINFYKFQNKSLFENLNYDQAILQSFITFIGFDRALTLLKQLDFKPSDMVIKISQSMRKKFGDSEDKK